MSEMSNPPTQSVIGWLLAFESALARNDVEAAVAMFEPDGYWRDLVAFTWDIRTQEGQDAVRKMLNARLRDVQTPVYELAPSYHVR